jgi:hypothetical protein
MKKIIILLAILMVGTSSFGQKRKKKKTSFSHAFGGSYIIYSNPDITTSDIQDYSTTINYTPRFNFYRVPKKDIVASIGSDIDLGFNMYSNGYTTQTNFTYQVPIILSMNFGHASHPDSKSGFGGFAGIGYNFHSKTTQITSTLSKNLMMQGLIVQGGFRFMMQGRSATLKFSYTKSKYDTAKLNMGFVGDYRLNIYTLGVVTNIGEY